MAKTKIVLAGSVASPTSPWNALVAAGVLHPEGPIVHTGLSIYSWVDLGDADNATARFVDALLEWSTSWSSVRFAVHTTDGDIVALEAGDFL